MTSKEKKEQLKKITEEILHKMTFENFKVSVRNESCSGDEGFIVDIETHESSLLIGQHGMTLAAFQHVLRLIVRRQTNEKFKFLVDVNQYVKTRADSISVIAREAAQQAISERKSVVLRPMNAYERRLVHLELSENKNIKTESIGNGEERKVVIRPVGELERLSE